MVKVTTRQIHAARTLLGWSQSDLAQRSGVAEATMESLEAEDGNLAAGPRQAAVKALEAAGIEFMGGAKPGVRMRAETRISDEALLADLDEDQLWFVRCEVNPVFATERSLRKALLSARDLEEKGYLVSSVRDLRDRAIRPAQMARLLPRLAEPVKPAAVSAQALMARQTMAETPRVRLKRNG